MHGGQVKAWKSIDCGHNYLKIDCLNLFCPFGVLLLRLHFMPSEVYFELKFVYKGKSGFQIESMLGIINNKHSLQLEKDWTFLISEKIIFNARTCKWKNISLTLIWQSLAHENRLIARWYVLRYFLNDNIGSQSGSNWAMLPRLLGASSILVTLLRTSFSWKLSLHSIISSESWEWVFRPQPEAVQCGR